MGVKVGFGSADLWGTWQTDQQLVDEITAQAALAVDENGVVAGLVVADFPIMWPAIALRLRDSVAHSISADPGRVAVFATQNHSGANVNPTSHDLEAVERTFVAAAKEALSSARQAVMTYVEASPSPPGVVSRRKVFGDLGAFTFWYGHEARPDGTAGCARILKTTLLGLATTDAYTTKCPGREEVERPQPKIPLPHVPQDTLLDGEADTLIQGVFFRTRSGEPIGSISRWPAHPATANVIGGGVTGDYPVYVRERLRERFGGNALFLTGPCGNQSAIVPRKQIELAKKTGAFVADHLLARLDCAHWEDVQRMGAASRCVRLPIRKDCPGSQKEADTQLANAEMLLSRRRDEGAGLAEIKRLADRVESLTYYAHGDETRWTGVPFDDIASGSVTHPLYALRLGRTVIAGMPGEPFGRYSIRLREACPDLNLVTAEECNGYLSYIPTADEYPLGGYGVCAALLAPEAEGVFMGEIPELVRSL